MKPYVSDATDSRQVAQAEMKAKLGRDRELSDIAVVLASAAGRRLIWRLLEKCRTFESVWENSARIHYNAGQQDLGHFLMAEIVSANPDLLFEMMKENKTEKD